MKHELEAAEYMVGLRHEHLICSLSHALVRDPVYTSDGQMYEKERIKSYWATTGKIRSPLTGLTLDDKLLRPAIMLKNVIDQCVGGEISSGKAAALAGSDLYVTVPKALLIEGVLQRINAAQPPDLLLRDLLALCDNVHLRDFATLCGALNVAGACFTRTHSQPAAALLVRMLVFSRDNQEQLAFVAREATAALRSTDPAVQTHGFRVLTALVADGSVVQIDLEEQLAEVLAPVYVDNAARVDAHPCLLKAALFFMVHLLVGRRASTAQRLVDAGGPGIAQHALQALGTDPAATNLACWFFSLLGDLDSNEKQRLSQWSALELNLVEALRTPQCWYFALAALLAIAGPRRCVIPAVALLAASREDPRARLPALSVLVDATRTPCADAAVFDPRPFVADVVEYLCVHLESIMQVVGLCCEALDTASVEKGIELLGNICHVFASVDFPLCRGGGARSGFSSTADAGRRSRSPWKRSWRTS